MNHPLNRTPGPGDIAEEKLAAQEDAETPRAPHRRWERCDRAECPACAHYEDERDGAGREP